MLEKYYNALFDGLISGLLILILWEYGFSDYINSNLNTLKIILPIVLLLCISAISALFNLKYQNSYDLLMGYVVSFICAFCLILIIGVLKMAFGSKLYILIGPQISDRILLQKEMSNVDGLVCGLMEIAYLISSCGVRVAIFVIQIIKIKKIGIKS